MIIYTHTFSHETLISVNFISSKRFILSPSQCIRYSAERSFNASHRNVEQNRMIFSDSKRWSFGVPNNRFRRQNHLRVEFSASDGWSSDSDIDSESSEFIRKRKVVDHISLLKAKGDLSDEEEKDMLDYLYTSQYQMGGIIAISLGRIRNQNPDGYTHAVYMRFQRKEDLAKFYKNSFYLGVLKDHVMPYCHELLSVDYEAEVEDDILPIFRKGEEFNYGLEFMLLVSVIENALGERMEEALLAHANLASEFPSLIVQSTQGSNFNLSNSEYTHAAVIRFRSSEAYEMFVGSSEYKEMWTSKFESIVQKTLAVHFSIDPVGTEIM
ncbi:Stress responsive alpha-beta barrel [Macleaya cordata]|uniref:Stress responsive alpha-beta barrel n=1 Tax=Macleaya cordata TaxID=56857 RepID=A0A200QUF2_MACCD|nr:Stress responsive alpha-beta barrel [Macleaya cordata]